MLSSAYPRPNPKRHLDRFSRFCTGRSRESLYFTTGRPFPLKIAQLRAERPYTLQWATSPPLKIAHLHAGDLDSYLTNGSLGPNPQPKQHLDQFSRFCRAHNYDRPTDRPRYLVCTSRARLRT